MSPQVFEPPKLLLIEDNPDDAELVRDVLEVGFGARRFELHHATDLKLAVMALARENIDLILLDLRLPDGVGVECIDRISSLARGRPIVVLTGLEDDDMALRCLRAGAQDYLAKDDVDPRSLLRAVGFALARQADSSPKPEGSSGLAEAILRSSSDVVVTTSPDGLITSWSPGASRMLGWSAEDVLGRALASIMPQVGSAAPPRPGITVGRWRDAGGQELEMSMSVELLRGADGGELGRLYVGRDVSELLERERRLDATNACLMERERQLRALATRMNATREDERRRLSREVHDQLGQLISVLKMDLSWVSRRLPESGLALRKRLELASAALDQMMTTAQTLALELRPKALDDLGLAAAVRDEARRFATRRGLPCEVDVSDEVEADPETSIALYRILQELLTNVARHARATQVRVRLQRQSGGALQLEVEDDGAGLPEGAAEASDSLGFLGIRERAAGIGGAVQVFSPPGGGTTVAVTIPA